jgi:hypothetical protein
MGMYVFLATITGLLTAWVWFTTLFPHADAEMMGGEDAALQHRGRNFFLTAVALVILSAAVGTFLTNRGIAGTVDLVKLAIKIWFGFFFPLTLLGWAHTPARFTSLIAVSSYWLVIAVEFAFLADWLLVG